MLKRNHPSHHLNRQNSHRRRRAHFQIRTQQRRRQQMPPSKTRMRTMKKMPISKEMKIAQLLGPDPQLKVKKRRMKKIRRMWMMTKMIRKMPRVSHKVEIILAESK